MASSGAPRFEPGSFRDPDTRVFHHDGGIYRALTERALADWERLARTNLFERFSREGRLIGAREVPRAGFPRLGPEWAAVLEHPRLPVVSYPYEWSFGMLRDAALLQLDLTLGALDEGLTLKDATPFNVQWIGARPTFIDVGSFTAYEPGSPWTGYRQFCETFLYPLLLQAYRNVPFHPWLRGRLDGITAAECRSLLSGRDCLRAGVLTHVYLQAAAQARYEGAASDVGADLRAAGFHATLIRNNVARLRRTVERLRWTPARSTWSDYQRMLTYDDVDLERKSAFVQRVLEARRWPLVWDVGCNTGVYSRMAADHADYVLALDADHLVVDRLYDALRKEGRRSILPLVVDVADPSPGLGWRGRERRPLPERGAPDLVLCLALAHHVVIGRNVPLADFVDWLAAFGADVIVEIVDRGDPMVERLLHNRRGQTVHYSDAAARAELAKRFGALEHETMSSGTRTLYHCRPR
ncbi:MAG: methyltransferase [Acidobacteria bacterium]|nr:methyltransferase [Acidobacteriota bacterium]